MIRFVFLCFFCFFFLSFFLICSEFCHTLKWNGLEFTCLPHPHPPSHIPLHLLPPGLPRVSCRVLLVVGWCQVLYSSGFLCGSSHYLILPRVSSLVVLGLGVSTPMPEAQGLISGQEQRFRKWFLMALSEIKTNIQKWETKDEPQTNESYKIR